MKKKPCVCVSFFFAGACFDIDKVSSMGIVPSETRLRDSFKLSYFAHTEWSVEIVENNCIAVSDVFEKLINLLDGKQEQIKNICEQDIEAGFVVVIHMEKDESLDMTLTRDVIAFAASVNAEIGFDLYYY